jgi:predicted transcriptional regulator
MKRERNGQPPDDLTRRERQIMDLIYQAGQATAAEVRAGLPEAPSDSAVRTLLRLLEEKGHLTHVEEGQRYVYRPTTPKGDAGRSALRHLADTFFGGSVARVAAALLAEDTRELDPETRARLAARIQAAQAEEEDTK